MKSLLIFLTIIFGASLSFATKKVNLQSNTQENKIVEGLLVKALKCSFNTWKYNPDLKSDQFWDNRSFDELTIPFLKTTTSWIKIVDRYDDELEWSLSAGFSGSGISLKHWFATKKGFMIKKSELSKVSILVTLGKGYANIGQASNDLALIHTDIDQRFDFGVVRDTVLAKLACKAVVEEVEFTPSSEVETINSLDDYFPTEIILN